MRGARVFRLRACRRGVSAVEFALVAPVLVMLTFGIVEAGRYLFTVQELVFATDRAARLLHLSAETSTAALLQEIGDNLWFVDTAGLTLSVTADTVAGAHVQTLTVSYDFDFLIPLFDVWDGEISHARAVVTR